jgi:hypothetical protein
MKGPDFAISGAGGRIAQHLALTEALLKGLYHGNIPITPSFHGESDKVRIPLQKKRFEYNKEIIKKKLKKK